MNRPVRLVCVNNELIVSILAISSACIHTDQADWSIPQIKKKIENYGSKIDMNGMARTAGADYLNAD